MPRFANRKYFHRKKMLGFSYKKAVAYVPLLSISKGMEQLEVDKKWKWPSVVVTFWIVSAVLVGLIYFIGSFQLNSVKPFNKIAELTKHPELPPSYYSLNGYLINTPGCKIPEMDAFDPGVREFIFKPTQIICNNKVPPLFESNLTSLFMLRGNLPFYVSNTTDLNCCYTEIWRNEPNGTQRDSQITYSENCVPLHSNAINIEGEFIYVMCEDIQENKVYEDYFSFVPLKKKVPFITSSEKKPNILILGLDAVSRVNLHRQLPNTYKYITEELDGVELLGYNKVADNTFPNLIPVLTGTSQSELQKSCWPSTTTRFDNCSFLWENFTRHDYVTAFGEDCSWMGIFTYQKQGFVKQPTDYYYTSFNGELESQIGTDKDFNCHHCVGGREAYRVTLDYVKKFVVRMKLESTPYFGFFWSNPISHDYLNKPALGDQTYYELLSFLKDNDHLKNTILIFMSDHGIRWGGIRKTYQGQMEERLPFVLMVLPKWFKENYPTAVRNLNKNIRRLTTPFDLHETLNDLVDLNNLRNARKIFNETSRGYSLFNEIPIERTCEDAEIDSHWCTCQQSTEIMINDTQVIAAAEYAVNIINDQLTGYAQCATLVLDSILNARVLYYDSEHFTDKKSVKDYTIILKTMPGEGVFEITVRYRENEPQVITSRKKRSAIPIRHKENKPQIINSRRKRSAITFRHKENKPQIITSRRKRSAVSIIPETIKNIDRHSNTPKSRSPLRYLITVRHNENKPQIITTKRKRSAVDQWANFTITGTVSRLNLYGQQSYCITDFHLKLYCYCTSLLKI